ncbi:MAG: TonB-dependent receptor, partial [Pseudomonadota bacterium]
FLQYPDNLALAESALAHLALLGIVVCRKTSSYAWSDFTGGLQIHWTNAPISVLSFARDTQDRTQQYALGGQWQEGARKLRADVSRTRSHNNLFFAGTILKATAPDAWQRASDAGISSTVSGISLLDPANFNYAGLMYRVRPYDGAATAATLDGEYLVGGALLDRWSAGLRLARREADNGLGLIFGDATLNNIAAGSMPGYTSGLPFGNGFFPGGPFVVSHAEAARDPAQMYTDFGIASPLPQQGSALGRWRIDEQTVAAYLMADFHALDAGLDANAGMRVVQTREQVAGNRNDPVAGTVLPLAVDNRYVDYLPSVNLRYAWNEAWQMRGALSRTITRPAFDQLSPSLNLVRNSVTPSLNQGSAGNPELKPIRASNLDVALEHYFGEDGALTATGFYKRVDGFIANASAPESYGGETYQVSRPYNSLPADIRGAEVSYQQFYRDWPGWLGGLGLNATYTYIDSSTPNSVLGTSTPLPNLSRNSYNLVGMYERGAHSARLAYNWRGRFMSRVASFVGLPPTPVYMYSYAWLDAAYSYRMSKQATLTLEGNNLLRTVRRSYYGDVSRPESIYYNDRRFSLVLILSQ